MKIALTFDIERDIPNILDTYFGIKFGLVKILKILDDFNIKGTFFCTGNSVNRLPEYVKLINNKGHEVACHGLNHERLNQLQYEKCKKIIVQNKELLENLCQNSEIIGFRAPYLNPPLFLFTILKELGFKYDSSIHFKNKLKNYQGNNWEIQEFHPSYFNVFFRLPISYSFMCKWINKKELLILYNHPAEAINMKNLLSNQMDLLNVTKNFFFRPDRWINTGEAFLSRFSNFIRESLSKKAEFVMLKQLIK
ncbi:MAG: polysaccharide deacetylase family protein [Promethearchaeota archaeon]